MRAAVSSLLSAPAAQSTMSRVDYQQTLEHHKSLLVLLKPLGKQLKPKVLNRLCERVNRAVSGLTLTDSSGRERDVNIRFVREYAPDQNDWGEFQAHRKLLGLLTFASINSQTELNEICRQHESLKVKYSGTLYDSRCVLMGLNPDGTLHRSPQTPTSNLQSPDTLGSPISLSPAPSSLNSPGNPDDLTDVPLGKGLVHSSSESSAERSSSASSPTSTSAATSSTGAATTPGSSARGLGVEAADDVLSTCSETTSAADSTLTSPASTTPPLSLDDAAQLFLTTPSNFKSRALYYRDEDYALQVPSSSGSPGGSTSCVLEADVREFVSSLFWVLEHKRLERSREKLDRVALLLAPFERKDFVGLDLESRTNKRRSVGRGTKHLADLTLQAGLSSEACAHYSAAIDVLKGANDWLWLGGAYEGLCAASASLLFPNLGKSAGPIQRNSSLQEKSSPDKYKSQIPGGAAPSNPPAALVPTSLPDPRPVELQHCLSPDDISKKYREAITHYSKYLHAAVLETEACFKAARITTAQNKRLQASSFLQNVILINLNLTEEQKIERFLAIADLYHMLGFFRKASFYRRLAGTRHVSAQNPNPDWSRCYQLLLQALPGLRLSLDPNLMMTGDQQGWPALQIQLLQELVAASRRMGSPQVAVRHLTFLLQAMWPHLSALERRELSLQLQAAASQCEGAPVPLVLPATGIVLPPANLTTIPHTSWFEPQPLAPSLRPRKLKAARVETGPFLFTPPSFGSLDRRDKRFHQSAAERSKLDYLWVEGDVCEVSMSVANPLPFELKVSDMLLLTEGAVFESIPSSLSLPSSGGGPTGPVSLQNSPDPSLSLASSGSGSSSSPHPSIALSSSASVQTAQTHQVGLAGIPRDTGELQITGYSTHVLGVKSSCRLKQLAHLGGVLKYTLQVVPALPQMQVSTSFPKCLIASALGESNNVVTSGTASIFAGETQECVITLSNCHASLPVTLLKVSFVTKLDQLTQREVFGSWDDKPMELLLPLEPGQSTTYSVHLYGKADFLLGSTQAANSNLQGDTMSLSSYTGSQHSSLIGSRGGPSSLPSIFHQPPLSPSHSLQFPSKPVLGDNKILEGVMKIQYSGGPGLTAGYCRVASVLLRAEVVPSLQVTRWDVLPAETGSEFYLVLDVVNQAPQEAELHYAPGKSILVEAGEFCRVPVPVPRCPLSKLSKLYEKVDATEQQLCAELERVCSEHIADNVALQWVLADGRNGTLKLDGIHCTEQMLDIIRCSPLDWDLQVDGNNVGMEEVPCKAGQPISLAIQIRNKLPRSLRDLTLGLALYQDHQNGVRNYRLETRLAIAGANSVLFQELSEESSAQHRCTVVFFTAGQYKADIHCTTDPIGTNNPSSINAWKLNPALQFCVSEA